MRVRVTPAVRMKIDPFRQMLRVSSIRDTYQEHCPVSSVAAPVAAAPISTMARVLAARHLPNK